MSLFGKSSKSCAICEVLPIDKLTPLYTHAQPVSGAADPVGQLAGKQTGPVSAAPTLTLSDDQIDAIFDAQYEEYGQLCDRLDMCMFARAVLAAAQEPK
jgi:hypothetical protein